MSVRPDWNGEKVQPLISLFFLQFDENVRLIIRHYDQASSEPEKSPSGEGRSLKPETPEPDGDSNQERAKDRGKYGTDHDFSNQIMTSLIKCVFLCYTGHQGETTNSFLATLASSSSEEMEAELQERVEASQKLASRVVELYECLKNTVDQLKAEAGSAAGEKKGGNVEKQVVNQIWVEHIVLSKICYFHFLSRG